MNVKRLTIYSDILLYRTSNTLTSESYRVLFLNSFFFDQLTTHKSIYHIIFVVMVRAFSL